MRVLIIQNCKAEGLGVYEEYLKENDIDYHVFHAYTGRRFPSSAQFDAFIVGGTPASVREIQKHRFLVNECRYMKRVIESNKPTLGICGGGQLLAKALGGKVRRNPVMEIGGYEVKLTPDGKRSRFFKGFPTKFPVFHWHGDTFDIPKGAKQLVQGGDCRNQAFGVGRTIGVQFHIEVSSKDAGRWADEYGK